MLNPRIQKMRDRLWDTRPCITAERLVLATEAYEKFAGEVPPRFVNSTPWGLLRNTELIRLLEQRLEERDTFQGRLYNK